MRRHPIRGQVWRRQDDHGWWMWAVTVPGVGAIRYGGAPQWLAAYHSCAAAVAIERRRTRL